MTFFRGINLRGLNTLLGPLAIVLAFQSCSPGNDSILSSNSLEPTQPDSENSLGLQKNLFFPEASGFGASLIDWTSAFQIVHVTKLSDTWPASQIGELRYSVEKIPGPKLIVFDIAGTIQLEDAISIMDSNVYIAGQTAPGAGITIKGNPSSKMSLIHIGRKDKKGVWVDSLVENVAVRYLRLRLGSPDGAFGEVRGGLGDNLTITNGKNIVLDHLSTSWSYDENISFWVTRNLTEKTRTYINNVTLQNSLLSEPLSPHPVNFIIGSTGDYSPTTNKANPHDLQSSMSGFSIHRNIFSHATHRNPMIAAQKTIVANNIVSGWRDYAFGTFGGAEADFSRNFLIEGDGISYEFFTYFVHQSYTWGYEGSPNYNNPDDPLLWYLPSGSLYYGENYADHLSSAHQDGLVENPFSLIRDRVSGFHFDCSGSDTRCFLNMKREDALVDDSAQPYIQSPATPQLRENLLRDAGASARVSCDGEWINARDAIDRRVITEIREKRGHHSLVHQDDVGGYLSIPPTQPCLDSDADGLPNLFESRFSDTKTSMLPFGDDDQDGFPNIVEYLNGTSPQK